MDAVPRVITSTVSQFVGGMLHGPSTTFSAKDIPDLSGRVILVTGGMPFSHIAKVID